MGTAEESIGNGSIVDYLGGHLFAIPSYQRSYSWKTPKNETVSGVKFRYQVKEFWDDIFNEYINNQNAKKERIKNQEEKNKKYYIGTIVLSGSNSLDMGNNGREELRENVVDGQQRLVTLYLLYIALTDWCSSQGEDCKMLHQDSLKKLFWLPSGRLEYSMKRAVKRLTLQGKDGEHLDKLLDLVHQGSAIDINELDENSNINQAFIFFRKSIQELSERSDLLDDSDIYHPIDIIGDFNDYMTDLLYAGIVKTEDDIRAHVVFEALNDRGIPLGAEDLIKNYLFSRAGNKYSDVTKDWQAISKNISSIESKSESYIFDLSMFDKFIQSYMNSYSNPDRYADNKKNKAWASDALIFPYFKIWFAERGKGVTEFSGINENLVYNTMKELVHASEMYTSLHSEWYWNNFIFKKNEPVAEYVPLINLLNHVSGMDSKDWYAPLYPLFFSALLHIEEKLLKAGKDAKKYDSAIKELTTFIHYMESCIFRVCILLYKSKKWPTQYESNARFIRSDKFANVAQKIRNGQYQNLSDIFNERIFDICFSEKADGRFYNKLSVMCIENTGSTLGEQPFLQFVKYMLRKIEDRDQEDNKSEVKVASYGRKASLEHVFPYEYSKKKEFDKWGEFYDVKTKKYKAEYVFRIGNYTLLHSDPNGKASNKPWMEKREYYKDSMIGHTVKISEYDAWDPDTIDEVQKILAEKAVRVWDNPRNRKL